MANRIKIHAKSLNLDLEGETEFIVEAYEAISGLLRERFKESVDVVLQSPTMQLDAIPPPPRDPLAQTFPMHRAVTPEDVAQAVAEAAGPPPHAHVVVCNEVYNKIYLVDREDLTRTPLDRAFDLDRIDRIYLNRSQRETFGEFVKHGKVLWRELTAAGRAVVKGS